MVCLWLDCGCLRPLYTRAGLAISTLSAIRRNLWYGLGFLSVDVVRTPVEGLVRRLPSLCAWLPKLELLCPTGPRRTVHPGFQGASGLPSAPAILHVPRLSGVVNWGVTEVLCAVTDQGPRILLDFIAPQAVFRSCC